MNARAPASPRLRTKLPSDPAHASDVPAGDGEPELDREAMATGAEQAAAFLRALSHGGRLLILCHLAAGEKSVGELERLLDARQAAVSQHLSRLRLEGLVTPRRDGKTTYYRLADDRPKRVIELMYEIFCGSET